ncbi:ATP synthase subunit delta, chloroplastic [Elaeis guineensis]|uniref:ATP synthase subunit delta, chloroplastic n=1 Tax=Elaeis guineensis var. tenera TaxID=51953 RepID=A0A6I9QBE1_ELAGV|nr:ATP synthase subunit delta, chloroplastic [Elaeis guineensis]XP_029117026.1 ATP synthase subunit delta, chloroplastic [Elaeis guineensis]XP_029117027.1 ATP synthase subunit delta, chloroplastic [Elaeis guineensis]
MAALLPSPAALRPAAPSSAISSAAPVSASLRRLPFHPRPRPLKLSFPRSFPSLRHPRRGASGATMVDTAASSYASALADVAQSNGTLEATIADVEKVDGIFSDPAVQSFFANPTISLEKKNEVVQEIASSSELQNHTANFLNILVDMKRIDIIKDIVKEFEACYNRITGTEVAVVSSVVQLESQDLAQIAQAVQRLTGAKNVRIKTVIDPSLVAGFTIRYGSSGSKLIDMSVKKQLDEIAAQLDFSVSLA